MTNIKTSFGILKDVTEIHTERGMAPEVGIDLKLTLCKPKSTDILGAGNYFAGTRCYYVLASFC